MLVSVLLAEGTGSWAIASRRNALVWGRSMEPSIPAATSHNLQVIEAGNLAHSKGFPAGDLLHMHSHDGWVGGCTRVSCVAGGCGMSHSARAGTVLCFKRAQNSSAVTQTQAAAVTNTEAVAVSLHVGGACSPTRCWAAGRDSTAAELSTHLTH